jgi:class 3 adenylate cyclase
MANEARSNRGVRDRLATSLVRGMVGGMRTLPTGTVTPLFTDIEGSTRLLERHGDAYADVLAEHRRLLCGAFERHRGVEVQTEGDAFFVAFASAARRWPRRERWMCRRPAARFSRVRVGVRASRGSRRGRT